MTIFLTGATGFLGSVVAKNLLKEGYQVRAIHREASSFDLVTDIAERIEWIRGDVLDPDSLEAGMQGVDGVFHCAAFLGFEGSKSKQRLMDVNVLGTANVVDAALRCAVPRMLHTSSIAALGRAEDATDCLDEDAVWQESKRNTRYALSKYRAELEIHRGIAGGLDAVMINPSLVMGPGRKGENTMQIAEKLRSQSIPVVPSGATNVVDVEDVAAGALKAFSRGTKGERYILAGQNILWKEIFTILAEALGSKPPLLEVSSGTMMIVATLSELVGRLSGRTPLITRETARLSNSISCYDNTKAREELGCEFRPFSVTASRIAAAF